MLHGAASPVARATPLTTVPRARPSPQITLSALAGKMVFPPSVELFQTTLPLGMPTDAEHSFTVAPYVPGDTQARRDIVEIGAIGFSVQVLGTWDLLADLDRPDV